MYRCEEGASLKERAHGFEVMDVVIRGERIRRGGHRLSPSFSRKQEAVKEIQPGPRIGRGRMYHVTEHLGCLCTVTPFDILDMYPSKSIFLRFGKMLVLLYLQEWIPQVI